MLHSTYGNRSFSIRCKYLYKTLCISLHPTVAPLRVAATSFQSISYSKRSMTHETEKGAFKESKPHRKQINTEM